MVKSPRVEAARVPGLGEQLLGPGRVVGIGVERQRELERAGDDVAGEPGEAELLGLVERLAVDGQARREAHALVVPGRARLPLVAEVEEEDRCCCAPR